MTTPQKSSSYNAGLDVLYTQFNDVNFYVEDEGSESFYHLVLKKLFPELSIEKIFPLGGKDAVLKQANDYYGAENKIYLVDKDYDDVLNRIQVVPNLFYLDRYSIENYLLEEKAIVGLVIEQEPKFKYKDVARSISMDDFLDEAYNIFIDIVCLFVVVHANRLDVKNVKHGAERFIDLHNEPAMIKADIYANYMKEVAYALNGKRKNANLVRQMTKVKRSMFSDDKHEFVMRHVPGKYLLTFLQKRLDKKFKSSIKNVKRESFSYRLANGCTFESLETLRVAIQEFMNSGNSLKQMS